MTDTWVFSGVDEQPETVTTNEYVPSFACAEIGITGFCKLRLNPFGPV
jgi:hypothetical protein